GESLIRNLLVGHRAARRFGGAMPVGYLPDPFGHTAQMPQILRGFGIESAVVWRGVGDDAGGNEFWWHSPDGSEVLAEHLAEGYSSAVNLPMQPDALRERLQHLREVLEPGAATGHLLLMNGDDHVSPQPEVPLVIEMAKRMLQDVEVVQGTLPQFFALVRGAVEAEGTWLATINGELRSPQFAPLLSGVLSTRVWIKQRNTLCEALLERWAEPFLAFAQQAGGNPGNLTSFLDLAWRTLLQNHAHDSICGCGVDQVSEEVRVRFDTVEQIARAVSDRALESIARLVNTKALQAPPDHGRPDSPSLTGALVVFNSESGPRTDFVAATIRLPGGLEDVAVADESGRLLPSQVLRKHDVEEYSRTLSRAQLKGFFRLAGPARDWAPDQMRALDKMARAMAGGSMPELVVDHVEIRPGQRPDTVIVEALTSATGEHNFEALATALREVSALVARGDIEFLHLRALRRNEIEVGFVAEDVPSFGYRTYQVLAGKRRSGRRAGPGAGETIENEFFSVRASRQDGTLSLIDKEMGTLDTGLNSFVDGADAGDEYNYSPLPVDTLVRGPTGPVEVTVLEDGPVRSTLRISFSLFLPRSLDRDRQSRSDDYVGCQVVSDVTLYRGVRRVDITTTVENRVTDHRLRVLFPTHVVADRAHAEGQFCVVERALLVPVAGESWPERPLGTQPQRTFVDLSDGEVGFAVANLGLPEYEVLQGEQGAVVALTLIRSVGWLSRDDLLTRRGQAGPSVPTPGAQVQGTHTFRYSLLPHRGGWERILHYAYWFARPMEARATAIQSGEVPARACFLAVEPEGLVVSAIRRADDGNGMVVRIYNPGSAHALCRITAFWRLAGAELLNLNEECVSPVQTNEDSLSIPIKAAQIVTLKLRFREGG
ncbi:MAG: alpha-mannosidase, partial [Chloroflexota bacterium]